MAAHKTDARSGLAPTDVCVCTFRRASLRQTLESLARQVQAPPFRVIVADNDDMPSAQALVEAARRELGLDIFYVHAPARNISVARNACLDAASAQVIAFIDDDETAPPHWLAMLVDGLETNGLDVAFGPVRAQYPPNAPAWAVQGDFHSFGPAVRADGRIDTGYSSNVAFRRAAARGLRFDPALGRSGGEDTLFFAQLHAAGARLGQVGAAWVEEPTPPSRLSLGWLMRRAFRSGQTHARVLRSRGEKTVQIAAVAAAKAAYCAAALALSLWSPLRVRRNVIRGALHLGVAAKALGMAEPVLYGAAE